MKVSINWLKELVDLKIPIEEVITLIPLRTIGTKEITKEFIELDMKGYNRADLLSMRGVAYEIAAITDSQVKFSEPDETKYLWIEKSYPKLKVEVEDERLAPLYCLAKIEGLKVEKSPTNWIKKLEDSGYRVVNNVADITNLVMLEYGQPMHAFDARAVKDENIIVRLAREGGRITTLDGKTRDLQTSDLLITDPQNALGIAGVMGGKDSEISNSTTTILLEAAIFDPISIRKTATRLKLTSEASKRFYHGLTKKRLFQALDAALRMYQELGGKVTVLTIVGDTEDQSKKIPLSQKKVNSLIGVEIKESQIEKLLSKLGFSLEREKNAQGDPAWVVTPPYYRLDIEIEEDLVEEIARMYGYEKIPSKELTGELPEKTDQSLFELIDKLKRALVDLGLTEVQTYSFYSTDILEALGFNPDSIGVNENNKNILVKIQNPISSETEYMRMNIWPNLLEVIEKNLRLGFKDIAIFELGKMYDQISGTPKEGYSLTITLTNQTDNPLAELNQILKDLLNKTNLQLDIKVDQAPEVIKHLFHPKRFLNLLSKGNKIGGLAEVHPRVLDKFGIEKRVAILEINLKSLGV